MDISRRAERSGGTASDVPLRDVIEAFLEHARHGVVVTDRDDRIAMINLRAEELLGYERREVVGKPIRVLVPEGLPRPGGADPQGETTAKLAARHKDGSVVPVRIDVSYPKAGGVLAALAFLREAEAPLHSSNGKRSVQAPQDRTRVPPARRSPAAPHVIDALPTAPREADTGDDLARALELSEFSLVYQPIIRLATGRVAGVEALLRWNHPERGVVSPGEFMAEAEESGAIHAIGSWVLRQAVADAERLQGAQPGGEPLMLSVNLSARQLADPSFAEAVRGILAGSSVNPGTVYLEVAEGSVMDDVDGAASVLRDLRATGVRMTIDDFGTGFSSLLHLNRFPIDFLKIDRSFVDTLEQDTGSANIVTAVIAMAHALGLPAIAEGVETDLQRDSLRRLGCDYAQGYLFARPQPVEQVVALLTSDPAW
jgi:PAS domain S-box-containing protein